MVRQAICMLYCIHFRVFPGASRLQSFRNSNSFKSMPDTEDYLCLVQFLTTDTTQAWLGPDRVQHQCTASMYSQQIITAKAAIRAALLASSAVQSFSTAAIQEDMMWRFDVDTIDITSWHCSSADCHDSSLTQAKQQMCASCTTYLRKIGLEGSSHAWAPDHCQPLLELKPLSTTPRRYGIIWYYMGAVYAADKWDLQTGEQFCKIALDMQAVAASSRQLKRMWLTTDSTDCVCVQWLWQTIVLLEKSNSKGTCIGRMTTQIVCSCVWLSLTHIDQHYWCML